MRRPLVDLASQMLPLASSLLDRVVLTGLLVRLWGVPTFEQWSVLFATVTMLSIADMGLQMSFSNRIAETAHAGRHADAARIFRESNSWFFLVAGIIMAAAIGLATIVPVQRLVGLPVPLSRSDQLVLVAVGFSIAAKMAVSNQNAVYRANLAFARGTVAATAVDALRVISMVVLVLLGFGPVGAGLATAGAVVVGNLVAVPIDIARRFPQYRYGLDRPTAFSSRGQLKLGLLYSIPFIPSVIMVQLPVVIMGAGNRVANGVLASFVLLRTLNNFLRMLIQKFTFVFGMEMARLEAQQRLALRERTYRLATRFIACLLGFTAGSLLGFGPDLVQLWVGDGSLFDPLILLVMLLPLVLTPTVQILSPMLSYANRPAPVATAILAQAAVAVVLGFLLPIDDVALRLTIAIFGSELVPLAPIILRAGRGSLSPRILAEEGVATALALSICALTYVAIVAVRPALPGMIAVIATGIGFGALFAGALAAGFLRPFKRWRASL